MCYLVLSGGGTNDQNAFATDTKAAQLTNTLKSLADEAKDGSFATNEFLKKKGDFKKEIDALKNSCKDGDEAVIFYLGHGDAKGKPTIIRDGKLVEFITDKKLKEILSGFAKGTTVSFFGGQCFGDTIKEEVEKAVDDKGDSYGDNFTYFGAIPTTTTKEWTKGFQLPLSDETGNDRPDAGNDDDVTTTDEFIEEIKKKVPRWFNTESKSDSFGTLQEEEDLITCPDFVVVGGELLPIETTSLILAGAQTFSWMIPLVLSVLGIGLFVVSRKSEKS